MDAVVVQYKQIQNHTLTHHTIYLIHLDRQLQPFNHNMLEQQLRHLLKYHPLPRDISCLRWDTNLLNQSQANLPFRLVNYCQSQSHPPWCSFHHSEHLLQLLNDNIVFYMDPVVSTNFAMAIPYTNTLMEYMNSLPREYHL